MTGREQYLFVQKVARSLTKMRATWSAKNTCLLAGIKGKKGMIARKLTKEKFSLAENVTGELTSC